MRKRFEPARPLTALDALPDALPGDERADAMSAVAPATPRSACFICQLDTRPCEVGSLEGALVNVSERIAGVEGQRPPGGVTLRLDDDALVFIILNEHARPLVAALAALPAERMRGLRLRVYHLWRGRPASPDHPARYHTSALSVVALEPDVLLNITDINNAEYCVRQYPLRRVLPRRHRWQCRQPP